MSERTRVARPGPRRPAGLPAGPEEVRRAVLDTAASLFARRGVDAVSLRDIAAGAHVNFALIRRYVGNREDLERAVFDDLSTQLAQAVVDNSTVGSRPGRQPGWRRTSTSTRISERSH